MIRRRDRLDEYVRQATRLDDDRSASLADVTAREALFERIIRSDRADRPEPRRRPARRSVRPVAVTASVVVTALAVFVSAGVIDRGDRGDRSSPVASEPSRSSEQAPSPERRGDIFGPAAEASCVEAYSERALAGRTFAFDGTVLSVERPSAGDRADPYVPVTFRVARWYRGGQGDRATVAMLPPEAGTSVGGDRWTVGSRLLVSGADRWDDAGLRTPVAWACGFTRWYDRADARVWERAFR